jgi:hypothetical protein
MAAVLMIGIGGVKSTKLFYGKLGKMYCGVKNARMKKGVTMTGIERIAAERTRQIEEEGYRPEIDDRWAGGQLAKAAICYAAEPQPGEFFSDWRIAAWPWDKGWWKPTPDNRIRELEKAGALIAAEIDRRLRLLALYAEKMDL